MPTKTLSLAGLEWKHAQDEWRTTRAFPLLLETGDEECIIEGGDDPSPAQIQALQHLFDHEAQIWKDLQETLVRYIRAARKSMPDWFEDVPRVKFVDQLSEVLEFQGFMILRQEHAGEALIGLSFSCEWDPEHGFGVALHRGHVVALGQAEESYQPSGEDMLPGVLTPEQTQAWEAVFGERMREQQARLTSAVSKMQAAQQRELEKAADNSAYGPALREFTRLIGEHPGFRLNFSLDVPQPEPHVTGPMSETLQKMMGNIAVGGPLAELSHSLKNMMSLAVNPPTPIVEVTCSLPGDFAMWQYSGQIRTERIDGRNWPRVLLAVVKKWPEGKPRIDSIAIMEVKKSKFVPVKNSPLQPAAVAAICELFGVDSGQSQG